MAGLSVRVTLDRATLAHLLGTLGDETRASVRAHGANVRNRARDTAPRRTGALADSHTLTLRGNASSSTATIAATAPYAIFAHNPTRAHVITPRSARALRFVGGSGVVFARRVNHPGTTGKPWLADALEAERAPFAADIARLAGGR